MSERTASKRPVAQPIGALGEAVDWAAPWLAGWREAGSHAARQVRAASSVVEGLNRCEDSPLHFVPQHALPAGIAYERFVADSARCPTRENLHDLLNGVAWMVFPRAKRALNRLHEQALAAQAEEPFRRGPVRDAATLFDENGAVLLGPEPLRSALARGDWQALFVKGRALWRDAQLVLFGHALLEKLATPRKAITAHVLCVPSAFDSTAALDSWLSENLPDACRRIRPFLPLPVLGVPGWWPANEDPAFYADTAVFRPPKP